ncbi:cation diffusion facilitator family transporter [Carboxylicivirga sp. M1479]|uniref:cation diffusion facilitator family transporter n=1 Tax=Carboxylicivirga sp. M1479 TaxID=2594476 RepID=UPI001178088D|nr:cation diffusion facilitator family transporter [Carboxylicivirga sp. M1479]TRX70499.1 cation transporter [Carboxylicivirga sp. M1479]
MGDHHHHDLKGRSLIITILLNIAITIVQLVGAFISNSLSLLTDALHNFSDVMALVISYIANKLSKRDYSPEKSFGYKRAEILAAFFNATTLLLISAYLIYEALERLMTQQDQAINGLMVTYLAVFSILANGVSVLVVKKHAHNNMNMRSAYLHLFSDMLSSIAVMIGGLLMYYYQLNWIDAILSVLIAIYLISASWKLVIKTLRVLMQFTPASVDIVDLAEKVAVIKGVDNIHHVHVWQLNDDELHLEAHIDVSTNMSVEEANELIKIINKLLKTEFGISHTTLQPEYKVDDNKGLIVNATNNP